MCVHVYMCACVHVWCVCLGQVVVGAQVWEATSGVRQRGRSHLSQEGTVSASRNDRHISPCDCKVQVYNLILNIQFF